MDSEAEGSNPERFLWIPNGVCGSVHWALLKTRVFLECFGECCAVFDLARTVMFGWDCVFMCELGMTM